MTTTRPPHELAFARALFHLMQRMQMEVLHRPSYLYEMVEELGAIGAAEAIVLRPPSTTFTKLLRASRLDLAVEAMVAREPWMGLFHHDVVAFAQARLAPFQVPVGAV